MGSLVVHQKSNLFVSIIYACMHVIICLPATWEKERFCLEYCALNGLKGHHVIKYCAPISTNSILNVS